MHARLATPHAVATTALGAIFDRLDDEWDRTARLATSRQRAAQWAVSEPALAGCDSPAAVVARVRWAGYLPTGPGADVLSALLRLAADPLAARALLQALLPRLRAERVVTARFGHGVGDHWQEPADTMSDLVAESFAAIARHAGEVRSDVARLVVQEATRKLRTARQVQRRYQERHRELHPGHAVFTTSGLLSGRTSAEWLATELCRAVRSGQLSTDDARLVYATRVKGLPASEVGRASGLGPKAVYYALAKAERALLTQAA